MSELWIEPFGGMAGDMFLAALLDLGDERFRLDDLRRLADALVPGEAVLDAERTRRGGIGATHLSVRTPETHHAPHRHYADLERLVAASPLSKTGRERALAVLWHIAVAEGKVHDRDPREIHFHEVGAVDTLVDVCGAVLALELLGVERVHSSAPLVGSGTVRCAHGEMPVPVPAVTELLRGRPMLTGGGCERLTPTAAALLVELTQDFESPASFRAEALGYGAGTRDPREGPPNLVRVQRGASGADAGTGRVLKLEVNLDDATGEELGFLLRGLRAAGALDVWTVAAQMKKDRPGVVVSALCRAGQRADLERVLFDRSRTLGVRWTAFERTELERSEVRVQVRGREVRVKVRRRPDRAPGLQDLSPEHDDLEALAEAEGWSLDAATRAAVDAALEELG